MGSTSEAGSLLDGSAPKRTASVLSGLFKLSLVPVNLNTFCLVQKLKVVNCYSRFNMPNPKRVASEELPLQPPEKRGLRDGRLAAGHGPLGQWDANIVANTSYTLEQLRKLYGIRLCGGRINKDVRETVEQVYNQFPEHHKFVYCVIQAALARTGHDIWDLYRFVFHKRLHLDTMIDGIFADAESQWNHHATSLDQTTRLLLVCRWNYVVVGIPSLYESYS